MFGHGDGGERSATATAYENRRHRARGPGRDARGDGTVRTGGGIFDADQRPDSG